MTQPQTTQAHQIQPPPQADPEVAQVAGLMAAGLALGALATAIGGFLAYRGISRLAVLAALQMVEKGTKHQARVYGPAQRRQVASDELFYRAAYVMNSARRIQSMLSTGTPIRDAVDAERRYFKAHEGARRLRLAAAAEVADAQDKYGILLGWYLNPLLNNDPECKAANGHNFRADRRPLIGWPGTVHPNCGCYAGQPIAGAGSVDQATARFLLQGTMSSPRYRIRKAS